ncbi:hypothetical protein V1J52_14030 [Streptomyces sp. TRM 70351]|uniref:hypothetical protein n=1 Tax=Streptomyces sp. TRM 70351 TaxID=3116552 RepID=UPI002E7AC16E|nr:hypothetical protein [Streptomyces sp. TRM 70351]MEE1929284.1 hypothetical protein [Streptomyces sp. TRM 70351]
MPRRVSLPAADELFRTTGGNGVQPSAPQQTPQQGPPPQGRRPTGGEQPAAPDAPRRRPGPPAGPDGERTTPGQGEPEGAEPDEHGGRERGSARPAAPGRPDRQPPAPQPPQPRGRQATGGQGRRPRAPRRPSGRERHDEKITVYVSAEELMDLEHARLVLRGEHGLAVDRGRIVREAVAVVLADLESRGDASILVRRLRGR